MPSFEVEGRVVMDQSAIDEFLHGVDGPVGKEISRRTIKVESAAKRYCPVDTGWLRSSITHEFGTEGKEFVGRVGTDVEYAIYQELGTMYQDGTPFLRPGLEEGIRG